MSSQRSPLTQGIFWWFTGIYAMGALASVMRLRFGDDGPLSLGYQRIALPMLVMLCMGWTLSRRTVRPDGFMKFLALLWCYGAIRGVLTSGVTGYTFAHAFQAGFAIILYHFGRTLCWQDTDGLSRLLLRTAMFVTVAHVPIMILYVYWAATAGIYLGMSASILILAACIFAWRRRWGWTCLAAIMIVLTGKRGEIAGLGLAALLQIALHVQTFGMSRRLFKGIAAGVLTVGLLAVLAVVAGGELVGGIAGKFANTFTTDFSDLQSTEARAAIGGRAIELLVYFQTFIEPGWRRILPGLGFGWHVPVDLPDAEVDVLHFVHVSPLNTVAQYGLVFAVLYWGGMTSLLARAFWKTSYVDANSTFVPYTAAMIVVSFTAYVISVDPMFWVSLGALSSLSREGGTTYDQVVSLFRAGKAVKLPREFSASIMRRTLRASPRGLKWVERS